MSAEDNIKVMEDAIAKLPRWEFDEVQNCVIQLERIRLKFGSSAELAIVLTSLRISKKEGQ